MSVAMIRLNEQAGMTIQAIIFSKAKFKTLDEAKLWATQHKFDAGKIEETDDAFNMRQKDRDSFTEGTFRTVELDSGIKAVMGKIKEAITVENAPWHVKEMPEECRTMWLSKFNESWDAHKDLEDGPRAMQAEHDADAEVRGAGWVMLSGGWMRESVKAADLPDSAFALIESGGKKDSQGRTTPGELRHFPHHGKDGEVDARMLKEAMLSVQLFADPQQKREAMAHLKKHSDELGLRESNAKKTSIEIASRITLKEAKYDSKSGEVTAVLIEAGTNEEKRRHYPKQVVEAAAPAFSGLKMYVNHPTGREEQERPERDLRDWAATIVESWPDSGKAMARIAVHDKWLKELLENDVARQNIGLSINCRGETYMGNINGKPMQIVERIIVEKGPGRVSSVDWVTEPGARGRVVEVMESRRGDLDMLETVELKDIKESRPDLVKALEAEIRAQIKQEGSEVVDEAKLIEKATEAGRKAGEDRFKELQETARKEAEQKVSRKEKLEAVIREATQDAKNQLPKVSKDRILNNLVERNFASDEDMKAAVNKAVEEEKAYLKEVSGVKVSTGGGSESATKTANPIVEGMTKELGKRYGVEEVKKEEGK